MMANKKSKNEPLFWKLILAVITFLNLLLTVLIKLAERQETLKALKHRDQIEVIATQKPEIRTVK